MEGVPRLPMIATEPKYSTGSIDFGPKIKEYIVKNYQEDPENYDKSITELNNLRESACRVLADSHNPCDVLRKYYSQLLMLKNRFPMEQGEEAALPFTWMDKCFEMPNPVLFDDIHYELACIMHNIGALHSQVAAAETRVSLEGIKFAFQHFQFAAWAFQQLRDKMNASAFSIDFDKSVLSFFVNVTLAQAQECVLEKSLIDHRKNTIIAKIAVQTSDLYKQCLKSVDTSHVVDLIGSSRWKEWKRCCQMKEEFYTAVAYLYMGQQADEDKRMGERLAWYNGSFDSLKAAAKLVEKDKREQIKLAIQFANDVISGKQQNAQKENDFIYYEKVPTLDSLPEIKGVALVKAVGFDPMDPKVSGPDLFASLLPLNVLNACSMYSEEQAKLLRSVVERVESKNDDLIAFKQSLNLDQLSLDELDVNQMFIPEALLERSAAINADPDAVPQLLDSLQRLTGCYQEAEVKLGDLEQRLNAVERQMKDMDTRNNNDHEMLKNFRDTLGQIREDLLQYRGVHTKATISNRDLQNAVAVHSENLKLLAMPLQELKKQLPAPPNERSTSTEGLELKRMIEKVKEMETQRGVLVEQLRKQLHEDDLTKKLLTEKDVDTSELFEKELKKHDKHISVIDQNLMAQTNILQALTEANAKYAQRRKETVEACKSRDDKIMALIAAYDVYCDVNTKAEQGRVFYQHYLEKLRKVDEKLDDCECNVESLFKQQQDRKAKLDAETAARQRIEENPMPAIPSFPTLDRPLPARTRQPRQGPRLGDYLDYYRAKKAGMNAEFPQKVAAMDDGSLIQQPGAMAPSNIPTNHQQQQQILPHPVITSNQLPPQNFVPFANQNPASYPEQQNMHPSFISVSQPQVQQQILAPSVTSSQSSQQNFVPFASQNQASYPGQQILAPSVTSTQSSQQNFVPFASQNQASYPGQQNVAPSIVAVSQPQVLQQILAPSVPSNQSTQQNFVPFVSQNPASYPGQQNVAPSFGQPQAQQQISATSVAASNQSPYQNFVPLVNQNPANYPGQQNVTPSIVSVRQPQAQQQMLGPQAGMKLPPAFSQPSAQPVTSHQPQQILAPSVTASNQLPQQNFTPFVNQHPTSYHEQQNVAPSFIAVSQPQVQQQQIFAPSVTASNQLPQQMVCQPGMQLPPPTVTQPSHHYVTNHPQHQIMAPSVTASNQLPQQNVYQPMELPPAVSQVSQPYPHSSTNHPQQQIVAPSVTASNQLPQQNVYQPGTRLPVSFPHMSPLSVANSVSPWHLGINQVGSTPVVNPKPTSVPVPSITPSPWHVGLSRQDVAANIALVPHADLFSGLDAPVHNDNLPPPLQPNVV